MKESIIIILNKRFLIDELKCRMIVNKHPCFLEVNLTPPEGVDYTEGMMHNPYDEEH